MTHRLPDGDDGRPWVDVQALAGAVDAAVGAGVDPIRVTLVPATMHYVVSANERIHWTRRYEVQRFWRGLAYCMFQRKPRLERALVVVTFDWPDRRRRDTHNYLPLVVKPCIDGIVQARVLPDDDDTHLVGPDLRANQGADRFRLTFDITPLGET